MPKQKKQVVPPLSLIYRKIAISFVVLTVLLVGIIVFFSLAKATVAVVPKAELKSAEFLVTVKERPIEGDNAIAGLYTEKTIEDEGQFETTGIIEKVGPIESKIVIVNTSNISQPLVATTRLLSPQGILFRIKSGVMVPAKGEVEAQMYADEGGSSGDIAASTRFTIPGLNEGRQKVIYGELRVAISGGAQKVRVVTAEDLEKAKTEVIEKAIAKARTEFEATPAATLGGVMAESEVIEGNADAKKGDERQTFTMKIKVMVKLLAYNKESLESLALAKLQANIPSDRELLTFNKDNMLIRIKNVNKETGEVQVSVYADASVRLNSESPILDPVKIAGMLPDEATRYLKSFDAVEEVQVSLFPSWQKRIPTIPDRIKIVIKK
ncbi:MAG: hypothetical protein Q7S48_02145 [bacterium]|nr:hypothetical protein [bacterium]